MNDDWVIGIDLGATKTTCALVPPENTLAVRVDMETRAAEGPVAVTRRIVGGVTEMHLLPLLPYHWYG